MPVDRAQANSKTIAQSLGHGRGLVPGGPPAPSKARVLCSLFIHLLYTRIFHSVLTSFFFSTSLDINIMAVTSVHLEGEGMRWCGGVEFCSIRRDTSLEVADENLK